MKRKLSIILALCMLMLNMPFLSFAAHWADEFIDYGKNHEFIAQNSDILNELDIPILRGEVAELISRAIPDNNMAIESIILGDGFGDLMLEHRITREEFFTVIGRAFLLSNEEFTVLNTFVDVDDISEYAKPYISGLVRENLVRGFPGGTIRPNNDITNAEAITMISRVHKFVSENAESEEPQSETPTNPPVISGGGGGSRPRPPTTQPDNNTFPIINYTLSEIETTNNPVIINLDVTSDVGIAEVRWVRMRREYGGLLNFSGVAHIPYNIDLKTILRLSNSEEGYQEFMKYAELCGGVLAIHLIQDYFWNSIGESLGGGEYDPIDYPEKYEDLSRPIVNNKIETKQNGVFYVYAKDTVGNKSFRRIVVENIKLATATPIVTITNDFSGDFIATVELENLIENPNAPIKEMVLIKRLTDRIAGGSQWYDDFNLSWKNLIRVRTLMGLVIPYNNGKFEVKDFGVYVLSVLDEWGNYSEIQFEVKLENGNIPFDIIYSLSTNEPTSTPITISLLFDGNIEIAKIQYVKVPNNWQSRFGTSLANVYSWHPNNRQAVSNNSFEITENGTYIICAIDVDGNVAFKEIIVNNII